MARNMNLNIQIAIVLLIVSCLIVRETAAEMVTWRDHENRYCMDVVPHPDFKIIKPGGDIVMITDNDSWTICSSELSTITNLYDKYPHPRKSITPSRPHPSSSLMIQASILVLIPSIALLL